MTINSLIDPEPTFGALVAVLAQVTIVLLAAIAANRTIARTPAARHTVLIWALFTAGLCPLLTALVQASGMPPLATVSSVVSVDLPSRSPDRASTATENSVRSSEPPRGWFFPTELLLGFWFVGSVLALIRLALGLQITHRIRRTALPSASKLSQHVLHELSTSLGRSPPKILISDQIQVPMAIGCIHPVVMLPSTLLAVFNDQQLLPVLIHECAHAVRRDPLTGLYQRLLAAVFWFHPLVHTANRMLDRAREELCDNYVLRGVPPTEYSRTLLAIAKSFSQAPTELIAQTLFRSAPNLDDRVAGLLNPRRCAMTQWNAWKFSAVAVAFVGGGGLLACFGASPTERSWGYDLSHVVHFEIGDVRLREGDNITITEVRGTSDTMTAGNTYVIKGTYRLASEKNAGLSAYNTANSRDATAMSMQSIPDQKTQTMLVDQGSGQFSLIFYMWYEGNPHISFYHGGQSIGGVYFGTGPSVYKPRTSTTHADATDGASRREIDALQARVRALEADAERMKREVREAIGRKRQLAHPLDAAPSSTDPQQ